MTEDTVYMSQLIKHSEACTPASPLRLTEWMAPSTSIHVHSSNKLLWHLMACLLLLISVDQRYAE